MARFVLLHGLAGQPEQWRYLQDVLEGRGHDALALRLPRGTWDAEVGFVRDHVDGDTIVVGHSLGGVLVRVFAEAHPGVVKGLATIAAPTPSFNPEWIGELGRWDEFGWKPHDIRRWLDRAFPGSPDELSDLPWEHPHLRGEIVVGDGPGDEPRLAIVCEGDEAIPYAEQQRAAADFRAPTASVPGGHSPHVRHPALVATLLINWLAPESA
ncbi:MAG TPA: alpha/beta fold hydrolase [Candidatus Limnocylindria bacterium]